MVSIMQRVRARLQKPVNWLWVAYAIFAGYLILDGLAFLASPYSGRVSRLACEPDSTGQTVCTVTIYGIRQIYRRSFFANDFIEAREIKNYTGTSEGMTCGITILTETEKFNFIHPYQSCAVIHPMAQRVNASFPYGIWTPGFHILHVGFHSTIYLRLVLLLMGLGYVLLRSKKGVPWLKSTTINRGQKKAFWKFAFYWAETNFVVRAFFIVFIMLMFAVCTMIDSGELGVLKLRCIYLPCPGGCMGDRLLGPLLCFSALWAMLLLKAVVQRQMLNNNDVPVSVWWIIAPAAASFPLLVVAPQMSTTDCISVMYLLVIFNQYPVVLGLVVYFLILGFLQWLALRRALAGAHVWVIMPLVNTLLHEVILLLIILLRNLSSTPYPSSYIISLSSVFALPALVFSELIPALYISWLVNRRNAPGK